MSMAIIGVTTLVVSLAGTAVAVNAQQNQAKAAEQTAEYNADVAEQAAMHETDVSNENARRKARENAHIIGLQREAIAASGLAPAGSPLAMLGESVMTLERDIMDMGYAASARATQLRSTAQMGRWEGASTASALRTSSYATAISGVSSAAGGYFKASGMNAPKSTV